MVQQQQHHSPIGQQTPLEDQSPAARLLGPANEAPISVNDMTCTGLVDSGSMVTTISESFYSEHLPSVELHPVEELLPWLQVEGAGGQVIPFLGYVEVTIGIASDAIFDTLALIVKDTTYNSRVPVVVGTNVIKPYHTYCKTTYGKKFLQRCTLPSAWLTALKYMDVCNNFFCKDGKVGPVKAANRKVITIAGNQTTTVKATVRSNPNIGTYTGLLQPCNGGNISASAAVTPSVINVKNRKKAAQIWVPVTNLSDHPITIKPKSVLCELHSVAWLGPPSAANESKSVNKDPAVSKEQPAAPSFGSKAVDLEDSPLDSDQQQQVRDLLGSWEGVFSQSEHDLGCVTAVQHKIPMTDDTPFKQRHRRIPPSQYEEVRQHLKDMLEAGAIRESYSPYASPIVLVRKKDNSLRLCIDYRQLNRRTIRDNFPLPRIEDTLDALYGARWFSSLDLKSGYWQIEMAEEDKPKTAFTTPLGFYECNRMPFGLTNAPATFQRLMERCMGDLNLTQCLVYLDDIIVFSSTFEEHLQRLTAVFQRLQEYGLKLKPSKCCLFKQRVNYLGHIISSEGVETDQTKTDALRTWPVPADQSALRSFLGFAGYYRRFIKDFSKIANPLNKLLGGPRTKKGKKHTPPRPAVPWCWTESCQLAFDTLRAKLMEPPILGYADFSKSFILHTDASVTGLGAALYQMQEGKERVIAYASRGLSKSERNYPAHKLEFLALKWAVTQKFHDYLYGRRFEVRTDNNPLTYVTTTAKLDATGHRWLAALSTYDFSISYRPGKKNGDADGLSRRPHESPPETSAMSTPATMTSSTIKAICQSHHISYPAVESIVSSANSVPPTLDNPQPWPSSAPTANITMKEWRKHQEGDPVIGEVLKYLTSGKFPNSSAKEELSKEVLTLLRERKRLKFHNGALHRERQEDGTKNYQLVIPAAFRDQALTGVHDEVGHLGRDRTLDLARSRFYWPGMTSDVDAKIKSCGRCMRRKMNPDSYKVQPLVSITSSEPMELVCMDFLTLEPSKGGIENVLVITDHFTKYTVAVATKNQTAKTTAKALFDNFFMHYGFPARLHSDQGRNFESAVIAEMCKLLGITKTRTTPYHPQCNGLCERYNRTLMDMLGTLSDEQKRNWKDYVAPLTHAYNCTKHAATGYSPYFLMFGRNPRLPIDLALGLMSYGSSNQDHTTYVSDLRKRLAQSYKKAGDNARKSAQRDKAHFDIKAKESILDKGDRVLVRKTGIQGKHKIADRWEEPIYRVVRKVNPDIPVYEVKCETGNRTKVLHRNLLLPCNHLPSQDNMVPVEETKEAKPQRPRRSRRLQQRDPISSDSDESDDTERPTNTYQLRVTAATFVPNVRSYPPLSSLTLPSSVPEPSAMSVPCQFFRPWT